MEGSQMSCLFLPSIPCVMFWLNYMKNIQPFTDNVVRKRKRTLIAFQISGYSSLILYQNSISGSFLRISYSVEFETISVKFGTLLYYTHWCVSTWNVLLMYTFVTPGLSHLGKIGWVKVVTDCEVHHGNTNFTKFWLSLQSFDFIIGNKYCQLLLLKW